jgi:hypothetical protein
MLGGLVGAIAGLVGPVTALVFLYVPARRPRERGLQVAGTVLASLVLVWSLAFTIIEFMIGLSA